MRTLSTMLAVLLGAIVPTVWVGAMSDPQPDGGPAVMRRLTQAQYRNAIADAFGPVALSGRFDIDPRAEQLLAIGAGRTTVTPGGIEGYDGMAMGIALQVIDPAFRKQMLPCAPAAPAQMDDACARQILTRTGRVLFRRPLSDRELAEFVGVAREGTQKTGDFYFGVQLAIAGLLVSPQFLFVMEEVEADPARPGALRLTAASIASRLSFLLWNSTPDLELLAAADRGELHSARGLQQQVDRMLGSPRLEVGVRAFFADMLHLDEFDDLEKDAELFPEFNKEVSLHAREQTLRTIADHLLHRDGDYRDLFTTRNTFITPLLASVYGVPYDGSYSTPVEWRAYRVPDDVPSVGILSQFSFLGLHSHPGKTSPTLRGKGLRESLMCQRVPDPPGNVDFSGFNKADEVGAAATVRERIEMHVANPVCAGCHKITDPIGLALENFNTVGAFRRTENNQPIDASGTVDGADFEDADSFARVMRDNARLTDCVMQRLYAYGVGRLPTQGESDWLREHGHADFAGNGYRIKPLLRMIAMSQGFHRATQDGPNAEAPNKVAHAD